MFLISGINLLKDVLKFVKNYRNQFNKVVNKAKIIADALRVDSEIREI